MVPDRENRPKFIYHRFQNPRRDFFLSQTYLDKDQSMNDIHIQFTRFSAFYSPLISTMSGGFLEEEGLKPSHSIAPAGKSAIEALVDGSAHVVQSALSQGLSTLEKGQTPAALHFAQINEKDGFFLTGREPDAEFRWDKLRGKKVLVDHGGLQVRLSQGGAGLRRHRQHQCWQRRGDGQGVPRGAR